MIEEESNKRRKGIETRHKILEEASLLISQYGFDNVSIRQITKQVGIKESSLYNHFVNKDAILESLFTYFVENHGTVRPPEEELDELMLVMQPEEIFKHIVFYFGKHINPILENTAMIITNEKYRNARAAEIYYRYVVNDASAYFERLIRKMIDRGMFKEVDAHLYAMQYNYTSIALVKEYYMARNGMADLYAVVKYMVTTIEFYCSLMKP